MKMVKRGAWESRKPVIPTFQLSLVLKSYLVRLKLKGTYPNQNSSQFKLVDIDKEIWKRKTKAKARKKKTKEKKTERKRDVTF